MEVQYGVWIFISFEKNVRALPNGHNENFTIVKIRARKNHARTKDFMFLMALY
jgi:hypothetical protein